MDRFGEGKANLLDGLDMEFLNEVGGHVDKPKMCKIGNCIHDLKHCHLSFSQSTKFLLNPFFGNACNLDLVKPTF